MTEHYYSQKPQVSSRPKTISITARGVTLQAKTDTGVFSKDELDKGTRILIENVNLASAAVVVDLGCGYGPVAAILGTVYFDSSWVMMDVNERALRLAVENTRMLRNRVQAVLSDGFLTCPGLVCTDVILNPPIRAGKDVVYRLFQEAKGHLRSGGSLWVVIQKKHGALSTHAYLTSLFDNVETCYKKAGYYVFRSF